MMIMRQRFAEPLFDVCRVRKIKKGPPDLAKSDGPKYIYFIRAYFIADTAQALHCSISASSGVR